VLHVSVFHRCNRYLAKSQQFLCHNFYGMVDLIYRALNGSVSMPHTSLVKFVYLLWFSPCFHYLACCLYITWLHPFSIFSWQNIFGPVIYRLNFVGWMNTYLGYIFVRHKILTLGDLYFTPLRLYRFILYILIESLNHYNFIPLQFHTFIVTIFTYYMLQILFSYNQGTLSSSINGSSHV
jgi:hypothetical protein